MVLRSEKAWKHVIRRLTSAIGKSIEKNVLSDGFHKSRLRSYIDKLEQLGKSKHIVDPEVVYCMSAIIFELLGGMPDYRRRRIINRRDDYVLDNMRTVIYSQSNSQKVATILEDSKYGPFSKPHKSIDLLNIFYDQYIGNPISFIEWYKDTYPQSYMRLF